MERHTWNLRVVSLGRDASTVYVRKHKFEVGRPVHFDEDYPRVSALEQVLGAFGADLASGFCELARKRRLEVDNIEVLVQGQLDDPLAYLGAVGAEGSPALAQIALKVFIGSMDEQEDIRRVWDEALARSPLYRTFEKCVRVELNVQIVM